MPTLVETSWRYRRLAALGSLIWSFFLISWIVMTGADTVVARDALGTLGLVVLGVISTYTGSAVWDDRNRMIHGRITPDEAPASRSGEDER